MSEMDEAPEETLHRDSEAEALADHVRLYNEMMKAKGY